MNMCVAFEYHHHRCRRRHCGIILCSLSLSWWWCRRRRRHFLCLCVRVALLRSSALVVPQMSRLAEDQVLLTHTNQPIANTTVTSCVCVLCVSGVVCFVATTNVQHCARWLSAIWICTHLFIRRRHRSAAVRLRHGYSPIIEFQMQFTYVFCVCVCVLPSPQHKLIHTQPYIQMHAIIWGVVLPVMQ